MNAFVQAPTTEKYFIVHWYGFVNENGGEQAIVTHVLYGMKSSGQDFRNHLRDCMDNMGYQSYLAGPDLWFWISKVDNGTKYYEYILLCEDDCLVISDWYDSVPILRNKSQYTF